MIKNLVHIAIALLPLFALSQEGENKEEVWKEEKEYLKYKKKDKYNGPDDWYGSNPSSMNEDDFFGTGGGSSSSGYSTSSGHRPRVRYSPQQIQRNRQKRYQGYNRGGGRGTVKFDPKVKRPDPINTPDLDAPDIDLPSANVSAPTISPAFWKILLFILIFAAVLALAYAIIKNRKPANKKVVVDVENDWNPEVITKTELELKLEAAMERGDYRECIRIYFTFILKELIKKGWIRWKKEKTNHHYVMEMSKRPNVLVFMECVRIYDLVWYGEYDIDQDIYEILRPELEAYYKSLNPTGE
jgi:hypothetical protein